MRDVLGPGTILGYCTNVHAGDSLAEVKENLERHAVALKQRVSPDQPMGVGLWFSANTLEEFEAGGRAQPNVLKFKSWLAKRGLLPYTINGFPYGNFHQPVVKHAVYKPDWSDRRRPDYTQKLTYLLDYLLPDGAVGSISTLPLGWKDSLGPGWADCLVEMIYFLADFEESTGRLIHLDLEPEPGCEIDNTQTFSMLMIAIEKTGQVRGDMLRRYLRVCHDVCHSAVMFEPPTKMLKWCRDSGFKIGQVQISSAVRAPFAGKTPTQKKAMRAQLESFVEPRYLHQTSIGTKDDAKLKAFYEDLPIALKKRKMSGDEWRVHFHVPIHLESLGELSTTQSAVIEFLKAIRPEDDIQHFEVETYAWNVLPPELQVPELADGIAKELMWVRKVAKRIIKSP